MNIIEQGPSPGKRFLRWIIMMAIVVAASFLINQCSANNAGDQPTDSRIQLEYRSS
ncbi:MAG: hypothetical protein FWD41_01455 [Actinomycetia bacterium]|nr:hypothetical protein [Actinomycetes bacterium]